LFGHDIAYREILFYASFHTIVSTVFRLVSPGMLASSIVLRAAPAPAEAQSKIASQLSAAFRPLDLPARLRAIHSALPGRVTLTTGFGLEGQAITHAVFEAGLVIDVVTLDTGRLFPETYAVWAETEQRYRRRIRGLFPDQERIEGYVTREGINAFRNSIEARQACGNLRKVEPLRRALAGATGWITGVRGERGP
jgi:phosphoadenosine phosphosulfate reductase